MRNKDVSIILLLNTLEKTDKEYRVSMDLIRYIMLSHGIRQTEKEVREDISILIQDGKNVKEKNGEFWME
jgi:hypothetical protein